MDLPRNIDDIACSTSFVSPIKYISGRIVEYDISSANITMLRKYNMIDDNYYNYLSSLPKRYREIEVGLLIRKDIKYYNTINNGIKEAKKELLERNNISLDSIVRVANDAVYINRSTDLQFTKFGNVEFKKKSVSSVMIQLGKLIIFFIYNENGINLDVKGLSEEDQNIHSQFMLSIIGNTIYMIERVSIEDALEYFNSFYKEYISLNLPLDFYRELSPGSYFKLNNCEFAFSSLTNSHFKMEDLNINYNMNILRELWFILLEKYNSIRR